jgi:hypothetical protein
VRRAAIARVAPVPVRLLLAASWRRRAGVGPGWLTRPAAAAAETAVVVASLAVWALWLVPVGPDGQWMTAADIARNAADGATMVFLPWSVPVALLEVRRRRLRRPDDTG